MIASLVRRAALSVEGVSRLAGSTLVDNIAEIVGSRRMQSRAITIEMADNNRVSIEIKLILKADFNIPEVAAQVQKAVIDRHDRDQGRRSGSGHRRSDAAGRGAGRRECGDRFDPDELKSGVRRQGAPLVAEEEVSECLSGFSPVNSIRSC